MHLLEVLNPIAEQRGVVTARPINARPATLDNLKVGLLWSGTHGGDLALKRVGELLEQRFQNCETRFYAGSGYPISPPLVRQAAEECDVVIGATAD